MNNCATTKSKPRCHHLSLSYTAIMVVRDFDFTVSLSACFCTCIHLAELAERFGKKVGQPCQSQPPNPIPGHAVEWFLTASPQAPQARARFIMELLLKVSCNGRRGIVRYNTPWRRAEFRVATDQELSATFLIANKSKFNKSRTSDSFRGQRPLNKCSI